MVRSQRTFLVVLLSCVVGAVLATSAHAETFSPTEGHVGDRISFDEPGWAELFPPKVYRHRAY